MICVADQSSLTLLIICKVLDEKDYAGALELVNKELVHPDAYDKDENTLLTEAAKRGELAALKFAVNELGASLDTSCDCPDHLTALHYAAKEGHTDIVKFLVESGAALNLINLRGKTALDFAKENRHTEIAELLVARGAVQNDIKALSESASFAKRIRWNVLGFFTSSERTILLNNSPEDKNLSKPKVDQNQLGNSSVIHLPPPKP